VTVSALSGPHIQARGYTKGRNFHESKEVDWLVIHTAEGATDEVNLGHYFANTTKGSSSAGIGQDGGYASYVNYADTCWAAPPLNQEADHLEICGFASWSRAKWISEKALLETVAHWIAWRCSVRRIPIRYISSPRVGTSGVTGHIDVNNVYHMSNHWDPGPNFPWDIVINRAKVLASVRPPAASVPSVIAGTTYTVRAGDSYWRIAQAAYKNGSRWPVIAKANRNVMLRPGMKITIPASGSFKPVVKRRIDLPRWPGYGYIALGKHNSYVQKMQAKLRAIGYAKYMPSGADGVFGKETARAVLEFQKDQRSLADDGVMGPRSWAALDAFI
jgi:LysM repeat protein